MKKISNLFMCMSLMLLMGCGSESDVFLTENDEVSGDSQELKAAVTYDYYVSTTGNDNNSGTSSAPFRTIQKALNMTRKVANRPNKIKVGDGTYNEAIRITDYAKWGDLYGNTANPERVVINASGKNAPVITVEAPLTIRGFSITGGNLYGSYGAGIHTSSMCEISHCIITGNESKSSLGAAAIYDNGGNFSMHNTLVYGNKGERIIIAKSSPMISYCTIADNMNPSVNPSLVINMWGYNRMYIQNTILYNPRMECEIYASPNGSIDLGIMYCNIAGGTTKIKKADDAYISYIGSPVYIDRNPLFMNTSQNNYRLADGSPCIDAAAPYDKDEVRPPGKGAERADMGAYGGPNNVTARYY